MGMPATSEPVADPIGFRRPFLAKLRGSGLEIGALQNPAIVPHLRVRYVDRMTREELQREYPELKSYSLVDPHILDDAETLITVRDNTQDFVIASHVIEHMTNPIGALLNWCRVLKPGGQLFLAVPDMRFTFDHKRELTPLDHLIADFQKPDPARNRAHYLDFALHVSCRHMHARPEEEYESLAHELEQRNYSIHYHVWTAETFPEMLDWMQRHEPRWRMKITASAGPEAHEFVFVFTKAGSISNLFRKFRP